MKARWNIILLAVTLFFSNSAYSISVGERSTKDYYFTTKVIREVKPMVTNFKNDDNQTKIESITKMYEEASLNYFGNNYDGASEKFYNLKLELMKFMEEMANLYINRTDELLKATIEDNKSIEIFLELDRHHGYATYFKKPFNPLTDVTPYDEKFTAKDYHYYYDAAKLERYLKNAYYHLEKARRIMREEDIAFIKSRKKIKTEGIDYVINRYLDVIYLCRIAKESGIEIYRVKNYHATGNILDKYQIRQDQMTPIFDDRIPEKFKVDAVDNRKLLYPVELSRRKKTMERIGLKES
ncbi:MAG TPA: hypothetical protein P5566_05065 [Spirochaetota bacterium]|nr:hypothetical protein [Spirochaetota bacterium]HRU65170.1 hypothetical protein [Spirochaetota bacterium]